MITEIKSLKTWQIKEAKQNINRIKYRNIYDKLSEEYNTRENSHKVFKNEGHEKDFLFLLNKLKYAIVFFSLFSLLIKFIFLIDRTDQVQFYFSLFYFVPTLFIVSYFDLQQGIKLFKYLKKHHYHKWFELSKGSDVYNTRFGHFAKKDDILDDINVLLLNINIKKLNKYKKIFVIIFVITNFLLII